MPDDKKLSREEKEAVVRGNLEVQTCPSCSDPIPPSTIHCPWCGAKTRVVAPPSKK